MAGEPPRGTRYAAIAPDTLDLAERAAIAINGLGGVLDPAMDGLPFGQVHIRCRQPVMHHWASADVGCGAKVLESFPLMRIMSGSAQHLDLERALHDGFMGRIRDGLFWDFVDPRRPWRNVYNDSDRRYGSGRDEDFCIPSHAARMARAAIAWWQATGDDRYRAAAEELVGGMRRIAIDRGDYSYYPERGGWGEPTTYPRSGWIDTAEARDETEGAEGSMTGYHAHPVYAAGLWHRLTGSPAAGELARRMARYCMEPRFWGGTPDTDRARARSLGLPDHVAAALPDPACTAGGETGHWFSHFHARATVLRGLLEHARAAGDERAAEFVRRSFEFSLGQGIARLGWIDCFPAATNFMEGCAAGDLAALAIRLTDAGLGDWWDDVDAVVRNQLVEAQLVDADALRRMAQGAADGRGPGDFRPGEASFDGVVTRARGIFAGLFTPAGSPTAWSMLCCTGNGTQGLYYAWEAIVRESGGHAQVNLLLNRASRLVDVDSWLPYEGRAVVRVKAARRVSIRVPRWVRREDLRATVGDRSAGLSWTGNYLVFDGLGPGDEIALTFAVPTTTARYTVNAHTATETAYSCTFRGSTCVGISPGPGDPGAYPFYRRAPLLGAKAPMKPVERFVAERVVRDW